MHVGYDNDHLYRNLRGKLDKMGFIQPFGLESITLINSLVNELFYCQEKITYKEDSNEFKPSSKFISLKTHMASLLKKICELHETNLILKQGHEKEITEYKIKTSHLEQENANFRFREAEFIKNIKHIELDNKEKSKLLLKLEENNLKAVIQTPGGNKAPIPFKHEKMIIDSFLPPSANVKSSLPQNNITNSSEEGSKDSITETSSFTNAGEDKRKHSIDVFKIVENQINTLNKRLNESELKRNTCQQELMDTKEKLRAKDELIERMIGPCSNLAPVTVANQNANEVDLNTSMDTSSLIDDIRIPKANRDAAFTDAFLRNLVKNVGHLRLKYDDLKRYLETLETGKTVDSIRYLEKENETMALIQELESIGEKTRNMRLGLAPKGTELPDDDETNMGAQESREDEVAPKDSDDSSKSGKDNKNDTDLILKEKEKEIENVTKLYKRNLESKTNLSFRINQLLKHEKDLLQEIEKLHHKTFLRTPGYCSTKRQTLKNKVDTLISDLEKDRNFYKDEYLFLLKYVDNNLSKKLEPTKTHPTAVEIEMDLSDLDEGIKDKPPRSYKIKHSSYKLEVNSADEFSAFEKLIKEKDDLQFLLERSEKERKELQTLYNEVKDGSNSKQKLEMELQVSNLIKVAELLSEDRNALNGKLKNAQEESQELKSQLESEHENLHNLQNLMAQTDSQSHEIRTKSVSVVELHKAHKIIKELDQKFELSQLRFQELQAEKSSLTEDLVEKERTLVSLHSTMKKLESRIDSAIRLNETRTEELRKMTELQRVTSVNGERDRRAFLEENKILRADIHSLTIEHKKLSEELDTTSKENRELKERCDFMETQIKSLEEILMAKEQEKCGFIEQCKGLEKQIGILITQRKNSENELTNLRLELVYKDRELEQHLLISEAGKSESAEAMTSHATAESMTSHACALEKAANERSQEVQRLKLDCRRLETICHESRVAQFSLQAELDKKISDALQLTKTVEDFKRDFRLLRVEVESRRQSVKTLEEVITCSRKRETNLLNQIRKLELKTKQLKDANESLTRRTTQTIDLTGPLSTETCTHREYSRDNNHDKSSRRAQNASSVTPSAPPIIVHDENTDYRMRYLEDPSRDTDNVFESNDSDPKKRHKQGQLANGKFNAKGRDVGKTGYSSSSPFSSPPSF
ncbi:unnamed protein product [Gordionus sp. m RMFG-2023]